MVITNVLTIDGRFYPVVALHKNTVTVRDYKKSGVYYNDIQKEILVKNIREVFINQHGGYWKRICTNLK